MKCNALVPARAPLLKRIYNMDALACPCGGRLRFISLILEADLARNILESLGLASERHPPRARSRDFNDFVPAGGAAVRA